MPQLDLFGEVAVPPPPLAKFAPRDYQQEAIDNFFRLSGQGQPGVIVRSPTGSGKTITGTLIADQWLQRDPSNRVIVVAHERQLIHQFAEEIKDVTDIEPGIEMSGEHVKPHEIMRGDTLIVVASRQTLMPRNVKGQTLSRLGKFDTERLNWLLIIDECHRWTKNMKSCKAIVEHFEGERHRRLGITATPFRTDKVSLRKLFPGIALDYRHYDPNGGSCALRDGWAVPYEQHLIRVDGVDFKGLDQFKGSEGKEAAWLEMVLAEQEKISELCDPLIDIVGDKRTIVFSPTIKMSRMVASYLCAKLDNETAAVHLDGSFAELDRKSIYRRHQSGDFQFLCVVGLCVARDTLILTDKGQVPIQEVSDNMKVWDGVEFVEHDGVIYQGEREVVEYCGLKATPDHKVYTKYGLKPLQEAKEQQLPMVTCGLLDMPIEEDAGWMTGEVLESKSTENRVCEVYDILNAGPRYRFTANGMLVSNCREGYNDPGIQAVAVFRPTKSRSLAEQMKGRGCRPLRGIFTPDMDAAQRRAAIAASDKPNCLIVDLVGISGLPPAGSTAQLFAEGKPDEVVERAARKLQDGEKDPAKAVEEAEEEIAEEEREKEREAERRRREIEEQKRRQAALRAEVRYSSQTVNDGGGKGAGTMDPSRSHLMTDKQKRYLWVLGLKDIDDYEGITKAQAGRMITQLKGGCTANYVRHTNGLGRKRKDRNRPRIVDAPN